jgi:hypothetical protein
MKHLSLKFALFGALFFLPVVISGCFGCNCGDGDSYYKVSGIVGRIVANTGTNYSQTPMDLKINLTMNVNFYANASKIYGGAGLYAFCNSTCDCVPFEGNLGSKERVKSLTVVSNHNFNDTYPAGTDLSPLLRLDTQNVYGANGNATRIKVSDFLMSIPQPPKVTDILFFENPTQDKKHIFTIRYELDNGEVYTYTTPEITFQ